jgi:hypothetical protein
MSWWVYLESPKGRVLTVERFMDGGTYMVGGSTDAELNVTYNYGKHFDFKQLNGLTGAASAPIMDRVIAKLGVQRAADYWEPTPGNVGHTLAILSRWATQHPKGVWRVS